MTMGRDPGLLAARDAYVLERMLYDRPPLTAEWSALLRRKLALPRLAEGESVPPDLARIDARIAFRCASGLADRRTLCLPGAYAPGGAFLPITTFYGLALLGLRQGEAIAFDRPEGRHDRVVLEKVLHRPVSKPVEAPALRLPFRVAAGMPAGRFMLAANENRFGPDPDPPAA